MGLSRRYGAASHKLVRKSGEGKDVKDGDGPRDEEPLRKKTAGGKVCVASLHAGANAGSGPVIGSLPSFGGGGHAIQELGETKEGRV